MFTTTFANKDREKFVNFYERLKKEQRDFFNEAIQTYAEENLMLEFLVNPYWKHKTTANNIFDLLQKEKLQRLIVSAGFNEILLFYQPFTYSKTTSNYWQNLKTQNSYTRN